MNARTMLALSAAIGFSAGLPSFATAGDIPDSLKSEMATFTSDWAKNSVIIAAVKTHNAKKLPMSQIKALDKKWLATSGLGEFMYPYLDNPVVSELLKLEKKAGYVFESFVMGNQGGLIGATNKTSDYWQGDEAKFIQSFKSGQGAIHVGKSKFDESAQSYLVQVSVPVMEGRSAIGAITIGVKLDDVK